MTQKSHLQLCSTDNVFQALASFCRLTTGMLDNTSMHCYNDIIVSASPAQQLPPPLSHRHCPAMHCAYSSAADGVKSGWQSEARQLLLWGGGGCLSTPTVRWAAGRGQGHHCSLCSRDYSSSRSSSSSRSRSRSRKSGLYSLCFR
jgi:hypothetical protein